MGSVRNIQLERVGQTRNTFDPEWICGTADDGKNLILIFKYGGLLVLDAPADKDAAWQILFPDPPDVPPEKGDWTDDKEG